MGQLFDIFDIKKHYLNSLSNFMVIVYKLFYEYTYLHIKIDRFFRILVVTDVNIQLCDLYDGPNM